MDDNALLEAIRKELLGKCVHTGTHRQIYFYRCPDEICPADEFLTGDEIDDIAKGAYGTSFTMLAATGSLRGDKYHQWTETGCDKLADFKHNGSKSRIMCTWDFKGLVVLLFGFTGKKENKVDNVHVNRAKNMRDEYFQRRAAIVTRLTQQSDKPRRK